MTFRSRLPAVALAVGGLLAAAAPAPAAWNNVFQVTCESCGGKSSTSFAAPQACPQACPDACPQACPQPQMRISYVQRCFYQPVTEMRQQTFYEPVTRNVTSFFYEPVTTYSYTTFYDPCTGCPQKVCKPCTSFRLRSQCNSVTSYVQRCAMVPVTTLRPVTVQQPVVSYYFPPAQACPPTPACPPTSAGSIPPAAGTIPSVEEQRSNPPSVENITPPNVPTTPNGASFPRTPATARVRPERTTSWGGLHAVRGEVVLGDQATPRPGAKLVFVNADKLDEREYATANQFGEFDLKLKAGTWYLYLGGENGRAQFHKELKLGTKDTYDYRVVSR